MYIKWIVCDVDKEKKKEFSYAQQLWEKIKSTPGFVAQMGGWNSKISSQACIISIWKNKSASDFFMENIHDNLFEESNQKKTYNLVEIDYFNTVIDISGDESKLIKSLGGAKILRIADCEVKQDSLSHFEEVQKSVWNVGMRNSGGMQFGKFLKHQDKNNRYLVATFWDSQYSHVSYVQNHLPELKTKSKINDDVINIDSKIIVLEKHWTIISKK